MRTKMRAAAGLAAMIALTCTTAVQAQGQGEYIVNSKVVSDTVVDSSGSTTSTDGMVVQEGNPGVACHGNGAGAGMGGINGLAGGNGFAGCTGREYGRPDLFYNYYTQGACNQANAQMYVSPQPVPAWVGHTFTTYQPLMPHQYLYWHHHSYHKYYDSGRGHNTTRVKYYGPPIHTVLDGVWDAISFPR
jgi:hypothetical protein